MIPIDLILNGISTQNSEMTAQENVDAAAVSVVAVKNVNQLPEDAVVLAAALYDMVVVLMLGDSRYSHRTGSRL